MTNKLSASLNLDQELIFYLKKCKNNSYSKNISPIFEFFILLHINSAIDKSSALLF